MEQCRHWEGIFDVLHKFKDLIAIDQKNSYIQRYAPLFLAEQIKLITF